MIFPEAFVFALIVGALLLTLLGVGLLLGFLFSDYKNRRIW